MKTEKLAQTYEAVASEAAESKLQEENPGNRQHLDRTHRPYTFLGTQLAHLKEEVVDGH